jgi:hypothetical protein
MIINVVDTDKGRNMPANNHSHVLSISKLLFRLARNIAFGLLFITIALYIGMLGYHHFEGMSWVDAFVNAAMILSGMGPVSTLATNAGKLFAGFYALFSGLAFIVIIAVIFSPVIHYFFHKIHLEDK